MAEGFAGGFSSGLLQSQQVLGNQRLARERNDLLMRATQNQERMAIQSQTQDALTGAFKAFGELVDAADANDIPREKLLPIMESIKGSALQTATMAAKAGLPDQSQVVERQFSAILSKESVRQKAEREAAAAAIKKAREKEVELLAEEEAVKRGVATSTQKDVQAEGLVPGTADFQSRIKELNDKVESEISVEIGGKSELTKTSKTKQQEAIIGLSSQLAELDAIAGNFSEEFLTFVGAGKAKLGRVLDKAGLAPESIKEFLGKRRRFTQAVNQIFNQYRREITGAAASVQELTSLKEAVISEDLSPAEFQAAYAQFEEQILRGLELKRELLAEGIDLGDPRFGSEFDRRLLGAEPPQEEDLAGISDDELMKRLRLIGVR